MADVMPVVTVREAFYATKTAGSNGTVTYSKPIILGNVQEVGVEKSYSDDVHYSSGRLDYSNKTFSSMGVTLLRNDLTKEEEAALLGAKISGSSIVSQSNDVAPEVAFGWIEEVAGGKCKTYIMYGTRFAPSGSSAATSEGSANFQHKELKGTNKPVDFGTGLKEVLDRKEEFDTYELALASIATTLPLPTTSPA